MDHVDYDAWAAYVHRLLQNHGDRVQTVLELAGGTGSLALRLQPLGPYRYTLTDGSTAMLRQAARKVAGAHRSIRCQRVRFQDLSRAALGDRPPFDAVVLVYDGLNYLRTPDAVANLFQRMHNVLRPGGIGLFDHATPTNSEVHGDDFTDEGTIGDFSYVRESHYDAAAHRHTTTFTLNINGTHVCETHIQRPYPLETIRALLNVSPLHILTAYDGRTPHPAHATSHRVHWVVRRPPRHPHAA